MYSAPIELIRNIKQTLRGLVRFEGRAQGAAESQMYIGALLLRDQRICCLLDPVVQELVGAIQPEDEPSVDRFRQGRVCRRLIFPPNALELARLSKLGRNWGQRKKHVK